MRHYLALPIAALVLLLAGCFPDEHTTGPPEEDVDPPQAFVCTQTLTGEVDIRDPDTTLDHVCVDGGSVVVHASATNFHLTNSHILGAPPEFFGAVYLLDGTTGVVVDHNIIDCGGATAPPDAASQGITGSGVTFTNNEVRNCADGVDLGSNSVYAGNYIHLPDNSGEVDPLHADGVQGSTTEDGVGIHDTVFTHNRIDYPLASSSFQFHQTNIPTQWWVNVEVSYNLLEGGAYVLRVPGDGGPCPTAPGCQGTGLVVKGNVIGTLHPDESGLCSSGGTAAAAIAVWGSEASGDPADDNVVSYRSLDGDPTAVLARTDC